MIQIQNLSKSYGEKILFDKVSFNIANNQKIGLIGLNGVGKSTLLKTILKLKESDAGIITNIDENYGYLPQVIKFKKKQNIGSFLREAIEEEWEEYKIDQALHEVGLENINRNLEIEKISGGQKTRISIAKLFISDPSILFLDEPTNNLDLCGLKWLEEFIKNFKGSVLVISHDRAFLDNVVDKIFELDFFNHQINEYIGGYSDYIIQRGERIKKQLEAYNRHQKRKKEMEEWIALKKQQLSVYINPKVGRQLQAMKKRFKREILDQEIEKPHDSRKINISRLANQTHNSKIIFKINHLHYANFLNCDELTIYGNDRIHLHGNNGVGKTTFIKMLLGVFNDFAGEIKTGNNIKIGHFSQEHEVLDNSKSVIDEFINNSNVDNIEQARKILGRFLFVRDKVFDKVGKLSQGEKVRLVIAELTNQENSFIIFDEPTNHLDLESREILEQSLREYDGGFMIVSHDRYFVDSISINRNFQFCDNWIKEF